MCFLEILPGDVACEKRSTWKPDRPTSQNYPLGAFVAMAGDQVTWPGYATGSVTASGGAPSPRYQRKARD